MKLTADDFIRITAEIQMALREAQTKMVELRAWLASLDLPTDEQPVSEETLAKLVANTRHEYTEQSLREELRLRGADDDMIDRLLAA